MPSPQIICLGEALIDFAPPRRGTNIISSGELRMAAGGAPANVAVGLARLETSSGFIGRVGADFFGLHLKNLLSSKGVDTSHLILDPKANTGLAFVSWDEFGNANYLFYRDRSADTLLDPTDISPDYIKGATLLHFGSLLLAAQPSAAATFKALEISRSFQKLISYDLNLRLESWPDQSLALAAVEAALKYSHIIKLNREELEILTGEADPDAGTAKIWKDHFKLAVVTLDKEGCFFRTSKYSGFVPPIVKVEEVVDTVGAGDGFMAGLLDALRRENFDFGSEQTIRRACKQAGVVGSIVVTRPGGIPAMPGREEVDRLLV